MNVSIAINKGKRFELDKNIEVFSPQKVLIRDEGDNFYLTEEGTNITIDLAPNADMDAVRVYVLGPPMGILLYQQAIVPLHACGIVYNNQCFVFAGKSGIGKSTLAAAFMKRGYRVICEDICVIQQDSRNHLFVYPGYPHLKLKKDTLEKLDLCVENLKPVRSKEGKFYFPLADWDTQPVKLASISFLQRSEKKKIDIKPLNIEGKFVELANNVYQPKLLKFLGFKKEMAALSKKLVEQQIPFYSIKRPQNAFMLDELVENLLESILIKK